MYAILEHGGHQYRVAAGDRLLVDRIPAEVGSTVTLEPVQMVVDGGSAATGSGATGASVTATVVAHRRGRKLRVFTYKPKKRRRRMLGHRSQLTELRVEEVRQAGAPARSSKRAAPKAAAAEPAAEVPAAAATAAEAEEPAAAEPAKAPRARAAKAEPAAGAAAPAKRRTPARKPSPAKADDGA